MDGMAGAAVPLRTRLICMCCEGVLGRATGLSSNCTSIGQGEPLISLEPGCMLQESLGGPYWPKADVDAARGKARLDNIPNEPTAPLGFVFAWHALDGDLTTTAIGRSAATSDSMPVTEALIAPILWPFICETQGVASNCKSFRDIEGLLIGRRRLWPARPVSGLAVLGTPWKSATRFGLAAPGLLGRQRDGRDGVLLPPVGQKHVHSSPDESCGRVALRIRNGDMRQEEASPLRSCSCNSSFSRSRIFRRSSLR
mmetsp:Transcript_124147/g.247347  ORF Transcript_124147/g.247347 Transcript_124147/m.247347 type:complete len:255 (+) Transcript_124147:719-1483(+)